MAEHSIYRDIAERTGGDIYIGVVGPVRSGKSTFINRFMQELVLPNMKEGAARERARDEMPQSAAGRTVMTTEPKFVPDEAVALELDGGASMRVKMIDCVGYMIPEAMGGEENGAARMVRTPWSEAPMPFADAAELGTRKVICEHATIGMLVTSDGTVCDIPRESYVEAEERLVRELSALGKPFALVLNSADPTSERSVALALELEQKYGIPVALVSCLTLSAQDIQGILSMLLGEFPITGIGIDLPDWASALDDGHALRQAITGDVCRLAGQVHRMGEVEQTFAELEKGEYVQHVRCEELDMGSGRARLSLELLPSLYYDVLSELAGEEIRSEAALFSLVKELADVRRKYARVEEALESVEQSGYGIVMPSAEELQLEKPAIVKQSGGYGVRLSASAQSIHMIRADIRTELSPIVGTEQQSEAFVRNILSEFESDPKRLWGSNMFGKSLYELVSDGLHQKLEHIPSEARQKLSETLERIVNEGSNGLICILL